jgi:ribonuclease PH
MAATFKRADGRRLDEVRPVKFTRGYISSVPGSVLIEVGKTRVICTASVEERVPIFLHGSGGGWVTAEYGMLPGSTGQRKPREGRTGRPDGRSVEIQRLIGRSMRAVVDLAKLGERTVWVDCDVIEADGGTRTAAITGGYVAMVDAIRWMLSEKMISEDPLRSWVAAVSVGIIDGRAAIDLCYEEDSRAEVDMNVVMTARGEFVEVQGTAEHKTFSAGDLTKMLGAARKGIVHLIQMQKRALSPHFSPRA